MPARQKKTPPQNLSNSVHGSPQCAAPEKPINVLLVDDHAILRQLLICALGGEPDINVVGEAQDGEQAIELARQLRPDVIIMDVTMPGISGVEATALIHVELPDINIIGLSMFEEDYIANAMRQAGAIDYVTKTGPCETIIEAIRKCMAVTA